MDNKKRLTQMLSFISATLGIVCIACFFFPFLAITRESGGEGFYTGIEVCLGYSDNIVKMGMNILLLVDLVLLLVTALITLTKYQSKVANLATTLLFIACTLLTFLLPVYAKSMGNMFIGNSDVLGLAWGSIACGIVSLIATVLNIATLIFNKKLENEPAVLEEEYQEEQPEQKEGPKTEEQPATEEVKEEPKAEETNSDNNDNQ